MADGLADRRYDLLETLAERIAAQVLTYPQAAEVTVTIEKLDRVPGALGVTLTRRTAQVEVHAQAVRPALLVMGSLDPTRFSPAQGTDLLRFFAQVFRLVLIGWLRE